jgi:hypothetical protein
MAPHANRILIGYDSPPVIAFRKQVAAARTNAAT